MHVQRAEAEWVKRSTGLSDSDLALHDSGDVVHVGGIPIELMHTPGHTPGSQCFLVDGRLVAGDTLFLEGCGRTDLPGSDPDAMYESLTQRLATLPDTTVLYPGHRYSPAPSATMGDTRAAQLRVPHPHPGAVARPHGRLTSHSVLASRWLRHRGGIGDAKTVSRLRDEVVAGGDEGEEHEADGRRREVERAARGSTTARAAGRSPTNGGKHSLA